MPTPPVNLTPNAPLVQCDVISASAAADNE